MLLAQLQTDGYSIFVVRPSPPFCKADELAQTLPKPISSGIAESVSKSTISDGKKLQPFSGTGYSLKEPSPSLINDDDSLNNEDPELAMALKMSMEDNDSQIPTKTLTNIIDLVEDDDEELQRAIEASMRNSKSTLTKRSMDDPSHDDINNNNDINLNMNNAGKERKIKHQSQSDNHNPNGMNIHQTRDSIGMSDADRAAEIRRKRLERFSN